MPMFRVINGKHSNGERDPITNALIMYKPGDIFFSPTDLIAKFNSPDSIKFERMPEGALPTNAPVAQAAIEGFRGQTTPDSSFDINSLSTMDVPSLIKLAQEEEIDLGTLKRKDEIVSRIKTALTNSVPA